MAYLDLANAFACPQGARLGPPTARSPVGFTALEWSVIALARRDTVRSLTPRGLIARAMAGVFGSGPAPHLADPRLEALRRLAVHAWRRGFALPLAEIDRFLSVGFVEAQIEMLVESVTGMRVPRPAAA